MKDLKLMTEEELIHEFLHAHQEYIDASVDYHIYLPKTRRHFMAQRYLDKIQDEINKRKKEKGLFS